MKESEIIELRNQQHTIILDRNAKLKANDYIGTKIAEGRATQEEYADRIKECQQWSDDINSAEAEIERLNALTPDEEPMPEMTE